MQLINAVARRSGNWWAVEFTVMNREYSTQSKRIDQVDAMVKDAASLMTGLSEDTFGANVSVDEEFQHIAEPY